MTHEEFVRRLLARLDYMSADTIPAHWTAEKKLGYRVALLEVRDWIIKSEAEEYYVQRYK